MTDQEINRRLRAAVVTATERGLPNRVYGLSVVVDRSNPHALAGAIPVRVKARQAGEGFEGESFITQEVMDDPAALAMIVADLASPPPREAGQ